MDDDEHVLGGILELRGWNAERAQHAPDEPHVLRVDLVEHERLGARAGEWGSKSRHGRSIGVASARDSSRNRHCQRSSSPSRPRSATAALRYAVAPSTTNVTRSTAISASAAATAATCGASWYWKL